MEIEIPTFTAEEAEGEAQEQEKNLLRRILIVDTSEQIAISNMIADMRRRLKNYINNLNN